MRILHLDGGRSMRGGQWQSLYLMVGQKTIGQDPLLLAPAGSPLLAEAAKRGVNASELSLFSLRRESKLAAITHAHDARTHTMAALAAVGPFVVSRRVAFPLRTGWLSKWKYSKPARYLAVSDYAAKLLTDYGIPSDKVGVVYDGVPVEPDSGTIGDRLITPAFADARKATALAAQAAQAANVALHVSEALIEDLRSARALLYLSEMEGLGSAALLAMANGVPVIASRVGGLPEIVLHQGTGLLVENNVADASAAITKLMTDKPYAMALGKQGRAMVRDGFTLAHMALRTHHEYKVVLK